jgi:hypothetical protein
MDDPTKLDLAAALEVIEDLLREQLKTSGRIPETIVTVGGTALAALRIRERPDDVDLYMSEIDDTAIHTVTEKYRARYGFDFKNDATSSNTIWGSFAIEDIDQSPTVATIQIGDVAVWRRAAGHGHVCSRRLNEHATPMGSGLSLAQSGLRGMNVMELPLLARSGHSV